MKKTICMILSLLAVAALCACSAGTSDRNKSSGGKSVGDVIREQARTEARSVETEPPAVETEKATEPVEHDDDGVDIDLTKMNSTMVYAQVYDMMTEPGNYIGKTVKMKGQFAVYEGPSRNYYAVIISDATACCSQGIEFRLSDERNYPDEYPPKGEEITVMGVFGTYSEGQIRYCELTEAVMEG